MTSVSLANALRVLLDHVPVTDEGKRAIVLDAASQLEKQEREAHPYEEWKVVELKEEIERRNSGRDDDEKIYPVSGKRDDLVLALYDDDNKGDQNA